MKIEFIIKLHSALKKENPSIKKATAGYWLGRLDNFCETVFKSYSKQTFDLVKELGEPTVNPQTSKIIDGSYTVKPENANKYIERHEELLKIEEQCPSFVPLKFEDFEDIELSKDLWAALSHFLTEPKK